MRAWLGCLLVLGGCAADVTGEETHVIHARFDPDAKAIPMPNDAVRDAATGQLNLPNDTPEELARLSPAEQELYSYFETLDGWSTLMSNTVQLDGAIDPRSVDADSLQVWRWSGTPVRMTDVRITVAADGKQITIDPPRTGWTRGDRYVVLLRGGTLGVHGAAGERVDCDAAFYFLRQTERLDTPEHEHAFPGNTRDERMANAKKLETIREDLAPVFDAFEAQAIPRAEVASLWAFTVTKRTELAMDKASQRMPLPIELMLDPKTGHVDLPAAPWDRPFETAAKRRLSEYTGFGLSPDLLFETTAPLLASTVTADTVKLYKLHGTFAPALVPADVALMPDLMHVIVTPKGGHLDEGTTYLVTASSSIRDADGRPLLPMAAGALLQAHATLFADDHSTLTAVPDDDAQRLEKGRTEMAAAIDSLGRDHLLAAWPFTTMVVRQPLVDARNSADTLGYSPDPVNVMHATPGEAVADFPLGIGALSSVGDVYEGTLPSPDFLDPRTRALYPDALTTGHHTDNQVAFMLTVPKHPAPGPIPVVIFGHGLVTERRFVLAVAGQLASKGFAAISIDFPYHGTRTYCAQGGPISVIDPTNGEEKSLNPCESGTTCNDLGRCVDAEGHGNHLAMWPVLDMPIASGAVFTDVDAIASTKDHFYQALVDMGSLERSLRLGDWTNELAGRTFDSSKILYAGQSLGGIMGAVFLGTSPNIPRAVLNVPGADLIRMFDESSFFHSHLNALFQREGIDRDAFEGKRLLAVASWIMDAVDPEHLGPATGARALLLQMATLDFIIPNDSTKKLEAVTGAPRRDYIAEHGFITIPVEPEYFRGVSDMADFLNGEDL